MQKKTQEELKALNLKQLRMLKTKCQNLIESIKGDETRVNEIDELSIYLSDIEDVIAEKETRADTAEAPAAEAPAAEAPAAEAPAAEAPAAEAPAAEAPAAEAPAAEAQKKTTYSDKYAVLRVVHGQRFDQTTGKEISKERTINLYLAEAAVFSKTYKTLGYKIIEVVHNPFKSIKF